MAFVIPTPEITSNKELQDEYERTYGEDKALMEPGQDPEPEQALQEEDE